MTAHELAKKLLELPDFEVAFTHDSLDRDLDKVNLYDVGYSEERVFLSGMLMYY